MSTALTSESCRNSPLYLEACCSVRSTSGSFESLPDTYRVIYRLLTSGRSASAGTRNESLPLSSIEEGREWAFVADFVACLEEASEKFNKTCGNCDGVVAAVLELCLAVSPSVEVSSDGVPRFNSGTNDDDGADDDVRSNGDNEEDDQGVSSVNEDSCSPSVCSLEAISVCRIFLLKRLKEWSDKPSVASKLSRPLNAFVLGFITSSSESALPDVRPNDFARLRHSIESVSSVLSCVADSGSLVPELAAAIRHIFSQSPSAFAMRKGFQLPLLKTFQTEVTSLCTFEGALDAYESTAASTPSVLHHASFYLSFLLIASQMNILGGQDPGSHRVREAVFYSLSCYDLQDKTLGYGNWVEDTKGCKNNQSWQSTLDSNPAIVRRRGVKVGETFISDHGWRPYWDAWGLVEMEYQEHIVAQVFPLLRSLVSSSVVPFPWVEKLLVRALFSDSPMIRKMTIFELVTGGVGIETKVQVGDGDGKGKGKVGNKSAKKSKKKRNAGRNEAAGASGGGDCGGWEEVNLEPAGIEMFSDELIANCLLPSLDSLRGNVNYHHPEGGKEVCYDLSKLVVRFITSYIESLPEGETIDGLLDTEMLELVTQNTLIDILSALATSSSTKCRMRTIVETAEKLKLQISEISAASAEEILSKFAQFLGKVEVAGATPPCDILFVLTLFPKPTPTGEGLPTWHDGVKKFISNLPNNFAAVATPTLASMYVSGKDSALSSSQIMSDLDAAESIALLSSCCSGGGDLWPSIFKGLGSAALRQYADPSVVQRAVLLVVAGCEYLVLGGTGNGELVVTKDGGMMPPAIEVERALADIGEILRSRVFETDLTVKASDLSGTSQKFENFLSGRKSDGARLNVLSRSFPSSAALSSIVEGMVESSIRDIEEGREATPGIRAAVHLMTLMVGLGCGAKAPSPEKNFRSVLRLRYVDDAAAGSSSYEQRARSTFQLCKWSSLEVIGREVFDERRANVGVDFALELCDAVFEDVQNSTYEVVGPLFEVGLMATEFAVKFGGGRQVGVDAFRRLIDGLWALVEETDKATTKNEMVEKICRVVYREHALKVEAFNDGEDSVLQTFLRKLVFEQTQAPPFGHACVLHLFNAFKLNPLCSLPYRDVICDLLVHKGRKRARAEQSAGEEGEEAHGVQLAAGGSVQAPQTSLTRAIALSYIDWLSHEDAEGRCEDAVKDGLLRYMLMKLVRDIAEYTRNGMVMIGTYHYNRELRSLQAICVMSSFITEEMAKEIVEILWVCVKANNHPPMRHYLEILSIQLLRRFPHVSWPGLMKNLESVDISVQVSDNNCRCCK